MKPIRNYMASIVLGSCLIATVGISGCAARVGVYDPGYRDYHRWNGDEERAYREYWREQHARERYLEYQRLDAERQREYWAWRHSHPGPYRGGDRDDRDRDRR
jgi:hypothetical protein